MCERFPLFKGERLDPKIEGDVHIIKFASKDTSRDSYPCTSEASPARKHLSASRQLQFGAR